ncbi:hypothetical protein [Dapis sp. BLCC M229]
MKHTNIYTELEKILIGKIRGLPPDKVLEIIDFVDFCLRDSNSKI